MNLRATPWLAVVLLASACSGSTKTTPSCTPGGDGGYLNDPYDTLDQYCMIQNQGGTLQPANAAVVPYDLNSPLFSDYATKYRTVWLPPGKSAAYGDGGLFDLPEGTIISKSFGFNGIDGGPATPTHWIETRILFRANDGWHGMAYVWDEAQQKAVKRPGGSVLPINFTGPSGQAVHADYLVPASNQCAKCHAQMGVTTPIGIRASELNRDHDYADGRANQIAHWAQLGILSGAPDPASAPKLAVWNDDGGASVEVRARAYLDANCSYCHSATGEARTTGLFLGADQTEPVRYGVCKTPVAAGRASGDLKYDVVPGKPDESILIRRMASTEASVAMPEIGRSVVHTEALQLVRVWITGLPGSCQ